MAEKEKESSFFGDINWGGMLGGITDTYTANKNNQTKQQIADTQLQISNNEKFANSENTALERAKLDQYKTPIIVGGVGLLSVVLLKIFKVF